MSSNAIPESLVMSKTCALFGARVSARLMSKEAVAYPAILKDLVTQAFPAKSSTQL